MLLLWLLRGLLLGRRRRLVPKRRLVVVMVVVVLVVWLPCAGPCRRARPAGPSLPRQLDRPGLLQRHEVRRRLALARPVHQRVIAQKALALHALEQVR